MLEERRSKEFGDRSHARADLDRAIRSRQKSRRYETTEHLRDASIDRAHGRLDQARRTKLDYRSLARCRVAVAGVDRAQTDRSTNVRRLLEIGRGSEPALA